MSELRILLVDDEPPALLRLRQLLEPMDAVQVAGCESRAERVIERCRQLKPDLVLMDVEMPGLSGVSLARELRELDPAPAVVFVTAYEEHAVEAFELAAVDYLVKPVRSERLVRALERARRRLPARPPSLPARLGERLLAIPLDQIRVLLAEDKYTCVYHIAGEALVDDSLVSLEKRFGDRFVRVHRNALVSRGHVRGMFRDADGCERVEMEGVSVHPEVSRRNRAVMRRLLREGR